MRHFRHQHSEKLLTDPGERIDDELAAFLATARKSLTRNPDEATTAAHMSAIVRAAAEADQHQKAFRPSETWRKVVKTTTAFAIKAAAGATALVLGTVGLAYAGVDLPGTASEKAFESVLGVELPNQATEDHGKSADAKDDKEAKADKDKAAKDEKDAEDNGGKSVSDDVHAVIDGTDERGCEFGQAVADAARANSQNEDAGSDDPCDRDDEKSSGRSTEDHGKVDDDHGKADEDHGKTDAAHGKADEDHSSSNDSAEKADDADGDDDADENDDADDDSKVQGKSAEAHGKADPPGDDTDE
jgi:hypothetical protein